MISRVDRSPVATWWWTIDKLMLFGLVGLMFMGLVISFAASPAVAEKLDLQSYFFVKRHAIFMSVALVAMLLVSFLSPKMIRRFALILFFGGLALMIYTLFTGVEIKGARRWINLFGFSLQPSELVKPAFVVLSAWLFSESVSKRDVPGNSFAIVLLGLFCTCLVLQPDIGQTVLVVATWCAMFFMAGLSWLWIIILGAMGIAGLGIAYLLLPHVSGRINRFIFPDSGDTDQVDRAHQAFLSGGWFGRGPGEGVVKQYVPDAHTDFIFAVIGEEFGILACLLLVLFFAVLVLRGFYIGMREENVFRRLAVGGLIILFGLQASINMAVNLQLAPTKGMTLPFISYGGSSLLSVAIAMGMVLGLARKRPKPVRAIISPYNPADAGNRMIA